MTPVVIIFAVMALVLAFAAIKIVPQGRQYTVERFGRYTRTLRPGITFLIPRISIGGHIGGLIAGGIVGYLMFEVAERRRINMNVVYGISIALAVALAIGAVVVAKNATPSF